jgi:heterodisulfide reductase subunit A
MEVEVPADLVVLGIGLQARDMSKLIDLYRCSVGADRFLLEVHPKLRPVELAVSGVFLGGSAQGPMDITEATAAAAAAGSKAAAMITQGEVEMDPFIAKVNEDLCTGCRICLSVCPYDAISRDEEKGIAIISEKLCTGCGTCAASCPSNAIQQLGFNDAEVKSEVLALLGVPEQEPVGA